MLARRYGVALAEPLIPDHPTLGDVDSPAALASYQAGKRAAKAAAALAGRGFVLPDDVQSVAVPVLAHRLLPTAQAQMNRHTTEHLVADIVRRTSVPDPYAAQRLRGM